MRIFSCFFVIDNNIQKCTDVCCNSFDSNTLVLIIIRTEGAWGMTDHTARYFSQYSHCKVSNTGCSHELRAKLVTTKTFLYQTCACEVYQIACPSFSLVSMFQCVQKLSRAAGVKSGDLRVVHHWRSILLMRM
jgi:hypothetical protein